MSATNRGAERVPRDFYETPPECARAVLDAIPFLRLPSPLRVLEPAVGNGAISRVIHQYVPIAKIDGVDLEPGTDTGCDSIVVGDFLALDPAATARRYDLIITNPPFNLAAEFIRAAMKWRSEVGIVVMLLRLNFLGSQKRLPLWREVGVPSVHVLVPRPSFTGGGNDATEYAFFVWRQDEEPTITIME